VNPLRARLIAAGLLCPGPEYPHPMTPVQLPAGTRVFRLHPEDRDVVPYKVGVL